MTRGTRAAAPGRAPVTGDDVRTAARWLTDHLVQHPVSAFAAQAGPVRWSCWTTAEHVVDDLLAYALQLAALPRLAYVPLVGPRGEDEIAHVDRAAGTAGLCEALLGGGELLATLAETRPVAARAYHPYGTSDAAGFAAMGVVEVLVHGHDVLLGLADEHVPVPGGPRTAGPRTALPGRRARTGRRQGPPAPLGDRARRAARATAAHALALGRVGALRPPGGRQPDEAAAAAAIRRAPEESAAPSFHTMRRRRSSSSPGTATRTREPRATSSATARLDRTATAPPCCTAVLRAAVEPR